MPLWKPKKNKVGIQPKPRAKPEIEGDYQALALRVGHKQKVIIDKTQLIERLEREIKEHIVEMQRLSLEPIAPAPAKESEPPKEPEPQAEAPK